MVRKNLLFSAIIISVMIADQLVKKLIDNALELNSQIFLIKNFLSMTLIYNKGAGFGIMQGQRIILIIVPVLIILGIVFYQIKDKEKRYTLPLALILGGALGNLIDRLFLGYVIDFIDFSFWPAFNIADSCISIGALALVCMLAKEHIDERKNSL